MRNLVNTRILLTGLLLAVGGVAVGYGQPVTPEHGGAAGGAPGGNPGVPVAPDANGGGGSGGQDPLVGEWNGKYVCRQGVTGLQLVIADKSGANPVTLIHFFPLPENPRAAEGCYTAVGSYQAGSGKFDLQHQDWVVKPRNYLMVDIHGSIDPAGQTLTGNLVGAPNCSIFYLARGPASRPLPDRCLHPR
jgi:hypothetical protein